MALLTGLTEDLIQFLFSINAVLLNLAIINNRAALMLVRLFLVFVCEPFRGASGDEPWAGQGAPVCLAAKALAIIAWRRSRIPFAPDRPGTRRW